MTSLTTISTKFGDRASGSAPMPRLERLPMAVLCGMAAAARLTHHAGMPVSLPICVKPTTGVAWWFGRYPHAWDTSSLV